MLARMLDLELDLLEDDSGGLLGRVGSLALNWDLENGFQTSSNVLLRFLKHINSDIVIP